MTPQNACSVLSQAAARALLNEADRLQVFQANKVLQDHFSPPPADDVQAGRPPLAPIGKTLGGVPTRGAFGKPKVLPKPPTLENPKVSAPPITPASAVRRGNRKAP